VTELLVERARVRHRGSLDSATNRLRLEHILAGSELCPPGLPPSAVLCIRRLADPRPGSLALDAGEGRPPPEWERACVAALERCLREAARPAREAVPAGANAVVFADRAEMLACLARDSLDGTARTSWWWSSWRRADWSPVSGSSAGQGGGAAWSGWLREPRETPAALELLAARGEAARYARTVPPGPAVELAARAAGEFGAPAVQAALGSPEEPDSPASPRARPRSRKPTPPGDDEPPPAPPWLRLVPEAADPALSPEQRLMLGVLLTLRRDPVAARGRLFVAGLRLWWRPQRDAPPAPIRRPARPAVAGSAGATPAAGPRRPEQAPALDTARPQATDSVASALKVEPELVFGIPPAPAPASQATAVRHAVDPTLASAQSSAAEPAAMATRRPGAAPGAAALGAVPARGAVPELARRYAPEELPAAQRGDVEVAGRDRDRAAGSFDAGAPPRPSPVAPPPPHADSASEPRREGDGSGVLAIETQFGGLFYLLNLAVYLGLYGDFTRPLEPGIALDPWELIDLIGAWLLGRRPPDPVWPLLARLAARPRGQPRGRGFRPPRAWRVPREWLEPFEHEGEWCWSAGGGVLRIVHPCGFPVIAVPLGKAPPKAQLGRELRRLSPLSPSPLRAALPREPKPPLARWAARLGAYSRARLRVGLGLAAGESPAAIVLEHPARVLVSPSHVDVVLALDQHPVELRLAGLDRDPGWIPAAGRYLAFHFE